MTQKERLIELFTGFKLPEIGYDGEIYLGRLDAEYIADYLLSNGVIILPIVFGNFYMPFEKDFDYGTLRAFADNRQAQDYLIGEEKA